MKNQDTFPVANQSFNVPSQNNSMRYMPPIDYYNQQSVQNNGTIPKTYQENYYLNSFDPIKKNYQQANNSFQSKIFEGQHFMPKPQNISMDYSSEIWNQSNLVEHQKWNRSAESLNRIPQWPGKKISGSYNALNVIGTEDEVKK